MDTTIVIVIVVAVLAVVAYFATRGGGTPQIEEDEPPKQIRPKKPAKASKPADKPKPKREEPASPPPPAAEEDEDDDEAPESADDAPISEDAEDDDEDAEAPVSEAPVTPPPAPATRRPKDVRGLRKGLKKARGEGGFFGRLKELFVGKKEIDPSIVEEMEEILLTSDVGVKTTEMLLGDIREALEKNELDDPERVWEALRARAAELLDAGRTGAIRYHGKPTVILMIGVNGAGKTTTIGKLATKLVAEDKKVLLVAGDTFRAAAVQQLKIWGKRVGCEVFAGPDDADPASVAFDAIKHGIDIEADYIFVDTAGRLHTKSNLMDELKKVVKTTGKALDGAPHETLLVVDGTTGQNAVQQAAQFGEALDIDGIVLTKLDGTAKGGVVLAIAAEQSLPVRYIGVGERAADLRDFDAEEFVEAMLGSDGDAAQAA